MGRFYLYTFDVSPKCPVMVWLEELENFVQQHQVSEIEAIKAAALHFEGKAYAWWLFEYFSLKNENTPTYARFIARLIERFDEAPCVTSSIDTIKPHQTNILHEQEGSMNPTPFLKTMVGGVSLFDAFPGARSPLDEGSSSQEESMNFSFNR